LVGIVFIPKRIRRDIIINVQRSSWIVPVIPIRFNKTLIFPTDFSIKSVSNFIKTHLVGAELFHVDRLTDTRKPKDPFAILHMHIKTVINSLKTNNLLQNQ